MMFKYRLLFMALIVGAFLAPGQARAQAGDTLVVEWAQPNGQPLHNALRDAILNDTNAPPGRVYKLRRGGFYWNEETIQYADRALRIVGETAAQARPEDNICGESGTEDCGPAIIQRVRRADQSVTGVMIQNSGEDADLILKNIWIMGQDDAGTLTTYEPLALNANNSRLEFDNVIFDRNNWHHLGINGEDNDLIIRNSNFRNLFGPSQQWEGLGLRLEVGADTVIIENNTFLNIGFTPFQSEAAPANYVVFNHNTLVNIGRSFQAGAIWKDAFVTNNLFVNPFFHGTGWADWRNEQPDDDRFTGFFGISPLPAIYGTELQRRIVLANNSYWRDPAFAVYYADTIRAQPLVNDTTMGWFDKYEGMVIASNYIDVDPGLRTYPNNVAQMIQNIRDLRAAVIPAAMYFWDPGRDESCAQCNVWPLPEDFSYTNPQLLSGGTDGLPLGNLNYFPAAKATYEANRQAYLTEIEDMAGEPPVLDVFLTTQAEKGEVADGATVTPAEGFTYFFMQGSGSIKWTFDLPAAGTYSLRVNTNMGTETQRGQHIRVNGTGLRNRNENGEYYFCTAAQAGCALPLPQSAWTVVDIQGPNLVAGAEALTMNAGTNTIEIAPSWGWQSFSGVDIVDAGGNVVLSLTAPMAEATLVEPRCESDGYCPQGFNMVDLGSNGNVSFNFEAPAAGSYLLRLFYQSDAAATASILVDGQPAVSGVAFTAAEDGSDVMSPQFNLSKGVHRITVAGSDLNLDYLQVIGVDITVGTERDELPEGYALEQNFPNPFNPSTTIRFELPAVGNVSLKVYDVLGREVMTLVDGLVSTGVHQVRFDAASLASGVYLYRLQTPVGSMTRTMILMK